MNLPFGMIALLVVGVLVYFGVAQRILDRMRLTDKEALLFILGMVIGSFFDIPIIRQPVDISINVGGGIFPIALALYLLFKADETRERVRGILSAVLVAVSVSLGSAYLPAEPEDMYFDPKLIYGFVAGIIAYLAGRSRRSAFVGGVLGIVISDLVHVFRVSQLGVAGSSNIGGAGVFDVTIIAGLVGVMIAEVVGETREKMQGGPVLGAHRPEGLYEFSEELGHTRRNEKRHNEDKEKAERGEDNE